MPPKFLTVEEAGRRLRVSRATVYRMIKSGKLPSVREHGRRRIPSSATRLRRTNVYDRLDDIPPFTLDNPMFKLLGKYRSDGTGPGSADKHFYEVPHWE